MTSFGFSLHWMSLNALDGIYLRRTHVAVNTCCIFVYYNLILKKEVLAIWLRRQYSLLTATDVVILPCGDQGWSVTCYFRILLLIFRYLFVSVTSVCLIRYNLMLNFGQSMYVLIYSLVSLDLWLFARFKLLGTLTMSIRTKDIL